MNWSVAVAAGSLTLAAIVAGGRFLDTYVRSRAQDAARELIDAAMQPIRLELRTMNGELSRIRLLEQKLENGLSERQDAIERSLDQIRQILMQET